MVDKDGNLKYSNIVSVNRGVGASLKLYPNPATGFAEVDGLDAYTGSTITLIDNAGKRISQASVTGSNYLLNVNQLAAGTYYVQVISNKTTTTLKFIKQ
jgi:hypothetical protein